MSGLGINILIGGRHNSGTISNAAVTNLRWFGTNEPSWATPYNSETTTYLKNTYPNDWDNIKEYGFEHSAIVPFINEDADLICSLVDVGYERWLVTTNGGRVLTGFVPSPLDRIEMRFKSTWGNYDILTSSVNAIGTADPNNKNVRIKVDSATVFTILTFHNMNCSVPARTKDTIMTVILDMPNKKIYINNSTFNISFVGTQDANQPAFSTHSGNSTAEQQVAFLKGIRDGKVIAHYYPCKYNNEYGLLDVVSAIFYPNIRENTSFTITMTPTI